MIGDRYEVGGEVGQGGTSAVLRGRDTVLQRPVALKRLGLSPGGTTPDASRAAREAHLAARVHHPNVVAVYDLADDGDHQWLVMELVDGPDLAGLADGTGVPPDRAARLLHQVAAGLAAAHDLGIVHRDVKPSNVLVGDDDVAKLGDFGIARARDDEALTRTGIITGSPAYLAPEVAAGRTSTTASDVWSFGATAFHLVTGRPPYEVGDDVVAAVETILDSPPPRLPEGHPLAPLIATTMRHDPDERPAMREVRDALALVVDTWPLDTTGLARTAVAGSALAPPVLPAPSRRREVPRASVGRRLAVVAAAAAIVATGGYGATQLLGEDVTAPVAAAADPAGAADADPGADLAAFVTEYLETAAADPARAFAMLGTSFQQAAGGPDAYAAFWDRVSDLEVDVHDVDPDAGTVDCTWRYLLDGSPREQTMVLHVGDEGGQRVVERAESGV